MARMNLAWLRNQHAWQPFTFRGAADFADASLKRVLFFQVGCALLGAAAVLWFLTRAWIPTVQEAISNLPPSGEIRGGRLIWTNEIPRVLGEGRWLSISIDPQHQGTVRVPAHLQVELGRMEMRFIALFGQWDLPYPDKRWVVGFNRTDLQPWWGAWRPFILWMIFGGSFLGMVTTWWVLQTCYVVPLWLLGFFKNRILGLMGAWKLAGAALLPAALFMTGAVVFYGLGWIDLVQLLIAHGLHWVIGIVYAVGAVVYRPDQKAANPTANPFHEEVAPPHAPTPMKSENPFKPTGN
jgi:hypothetical protein